MNDNAAVFTDTEDDGRRRVVLTHRRPDDLPADRRAQAFMFAADGHAVQFELVERGPEHLPDHVAAKVREATDLDELKAALLGE